jgi:hypothetical protein
MYNFKQIELNNLIIHSVGNRSKEEDLFLSQRELSLDEAQKSILLSYFLNPFKTDEYYQFTGEEAADEDTKYQGNRMYQHIQDLIKYPEQFVAISQKIAAFLFDLTTHPKIKNGKLHIVKFSNCILDDEIISAIGIFKSESRDPFIKLYPSGDVVEMERSEGIGLNKLDRACLIFNTNKDTGYKILMQDKTKGDALPHWQYDFLGIKRREEEYHHTENFINLIKTFTEDVLTEENNVEVSDKISFVQRTEDYLKHNDHLSTQEFAEEVIGNSDIVDAFNNYIPTYENDFDTKVETEFPLSKQAVKQHKKYFKSVIKLDKSFHVYVHTNPENIEKGFDPSRDMKYYKLYYSEEE